MFGNSIDTGNIAANISGSNCDHIYSVEDELLSNCDHKSCVGDELLSNCDTKESVEDETNFNCDTKENVEDETNSNFDTCLVEDEPIRMGGENSTLLDIISHDHICQPLGLEDEFCGIDAVQDSLLEDMVRCSLTLLHRGITLKSGKQNKHCMMQQNVILLVKIMMISIMVHNMI